MREFFDDFSNPALSTFYEFVPGVGTLTRCKDGLHYAITRGPDGPASALDYFTIDSLGRPQPPTARVVLEFRGPEWSVEAVVDYQFETRMNGRSAHLGVAFGQPSQLFRDGIVVSRSADLDTSSHTLTANLYDEPLETRYLELTRHPRNQNWFRMCRSGARLQLEWSEDGLRYQTVSNSELRAPDLRQFIVLNSSSFAGGAAFVLKSLRISGAEVVESPRRPEPFSRSGHAVQTSVEASDILQAIKEGRDIILTNSEIAGTLDLGAATSPIQSRILMRGCRFPDPLIAWTGAVFAGAALLVGCRFSQVGLSNAHFTNFFQAAGCEFSADTRFIETNFAAGADFSLSTFREKPFFRVAQAGRAVSFYHCDFVKSADLSSARFAADLSLADVAVHSGIVTLYGSEIGGVLRLIATLQREPQQLGEALDLTKARIKSLVISSGDRKNRGEYTGPARWQFHSSVFLREAVIGEMLLYNTSFRQLVDLTDSEIQTVVNDGAEFDHIKGEWPVLTEYYSCFISYSARDGGFANQFYNDLISAGVECWFAPESLRTGDQFKDLILAAIRKYDRFLLILSSESVASDWVAFEAQAAAAREVSERRKVLLPIRLDEAVLHSHQPWAVEMRENRHIADFSGWKDPEIYRIALDRLRQELKPPQTMRLV